MRDARPSAVLEEAPPGPPGQRAAVTHRLAFHPWYGLATLLYMGAIILLSSMPHQPATPRQRLLEYGMNLGHVPLYAGLTLLLIRTIVPRPGLSLATRACVGAALLLVTFAVIDEGHQAFVPGRSASVIDLLFDMMGIGAVLLFHRLSALVSEES